MQYTLYKSFIIIKQQNHREWIEQLLDIALYAHKRLR